MTRAPIHRPLQPVPEPSIKSRAGIAFLSTVVGPGYLTRMEHHREPIATPPQRPNQLLPAVCLEHQRPGLAQRMWRIDGCPLFLHTLFNA